MKAAKIKKTNIKQEKIDIEEEYSVKKMATIIVILLIIFGIFYLITDLVVKPNKNQSTDNNITEIDYKKITLNNLLNRN